MPAGDRPGWLVRPGEPEANDRDSSDRHRGHTRDGPGTAPRPACTCRRPLGQPGGLWHRGRGTFQRSPQFILELDVAHDNLSSTRWDSLALRKAATARLAVARTEDGLMPSTSAIVWSSRSW